MKHLAGLIIILLLFLSSTGCSNNRDVANRVSNTNNVDEVIKEQIDNSESNTNPADSGKQTSNNDGSEGIIITSKNSSNGYANVDYDLTTMNSDMVYATVYQVMSDPEAYTGKTFRMNGLYYASYYEPSAKYYHYCIIKDAMACCAQGIEFVWGDGSHVYPNEYPKNDAEILIQGTFETYREEGDANLYCHLQNATMEVIN